MVYKAYLDLFRTREIFKSMINEELFKRQSLQTKKRLNKGAKLSPPTSPQKSSLNMNSFTSLYVIQLFEAVNYEFNANVMQNLKFNVKSEFLCHKDKHNLKIYLQTWYVNHD